MLSSVCQTPIINDHGINVALFLFPPILTEVCSAEDLPEVEIFSLLEEQIPRYKIRADTTTTFGGYENQDWFVQYPALPIPTEGLGLTTEQTREALNYFRK